jgi:hypothetical protein
MVAASFIILLGNATYIPPYRFSDVSYDMESMNFMCFFFEGGRFR